MARALEPSEFARLVLENLPLGVAGAAMQRRGIGSSVPAQQEALGSCANGIRDSPKDTYNRGMERYSRTVRQMLHGPTSTGTRHLPEGQWKRALAQDPGFLPRLSWKMGPRVPTDWDVTIKSLKAEQGLVVFCDTSAFDDSVPLALWDVLLREPGGLVLTERVRYELQPWLQKRPDHPVTRAVIDAHPGLGRRPEPKPGEDGRKAFDYYMALLSARRALMTMMRAWFQREHGRDPDPGEDRALLDELQRGLGERARLLATKPAGNQTDEGLVYLAVEHALITGKQTLVLTRDADVEEQFFKLLWLIDTHYREMLLADRYIESFAVLRTHPIPLAYLASPACPFEPHDGVVFARSVDLREVLPPKTHFVAVSCTNAGVYSSQIAFGAETEMARVLRVKDSTGGLSTDRLGRRNLHAVLPPLPDLRHGPYAAVVYDKRVPVGKDGASIPRLDILDALSTDEQHLTLAPMAESSSRFWTPPKRRNPT